MTEIFTALSSVYELVITYFGSVVSVIITNPLLYVPVLISLAAGLIMFAVGTVRRMGLRGVGSGRRRRRR